MPNPLPTSYALIPLVSSLCPMPIATCPIPLIHYTLTPKAHNKKYIGKIPSISKLPYPYTKGPLHRNGEDPITLYGSN